MLPTLIVSVKIGNFSSRESIDSFSFHRLRTMRVKLRTILNNISAHPNCLLGAKISCLTIKCHETERESKRLYVGGVVSSPIHVANVERIGGLYKGACDTF